MNQCNTNQTRVTEEMSLCAVTEFPECTVPAMAYVPFQLDLSHFSAEEALCKGTLFPVLSKPFRGRCT
ncbi:MAG: spore coat associated protein CotJA [Clostridiales bacterium]|nr:spore coat associated protein CotJA [Clostridiales bacterium]MCD7827676.1 spore coat associated protein CotJA [Clostridiales bacterium]